MVRFGGRDHILLEMPLGRCTAEPSKGLLKSTLCTPYRLGFACMMVRKYSFQR
jgi:hypothetical protein